MQPVLVDEYDAIGGLVLSQLFDLMDSLLWRAFSLVVQADPDLARKCVLAPVIKDLAGLSYGRKWFMAGCEVKKQKPYIITAVKTWQEGGITDAEFLIRIKRLNFYRDIIREWIEISVEVGQNLNPYVRILWEAYLACRERVALAYAPIVWRVAKNKSFNVGHVQELYQVGFPGLIHAIERYRNQGPMVFGSFAYRWVRQAVLLYTTRGTALIKVAHTMMEEGNNISKKESVTGKRDDSARANLVKGLMKHGNVVLMDKPPEMIECRELELEMDLANSPLMQLFEEEL